jgi:hypothetical protein
MAQITDPRQGFQRNKNLLSKMAAKAMARKGYKSKLGVFGKLAAGGQQTRALRPMRGPGSNALRGARPQGYGDFFDGMDRLGRGQQESYVNTAPVQAPIPDMYQQHQDPAMAPAPFVGASGQGAPWVDTGVGTTSPDWDPNPQEVQVGGQSYAMFPGDMGHGALQQQGGGSSPITAPGGLIPLGGGRYYDPATDTIHGGSVGGKTFAV